MSAVPDLIVLSHYEVAPLLKARQEGHTSASISPDLGLTTIEVALSPEGVTFPTREELNWQAVEEIARSETKCFHLEGSVLSEIRVFSELTGRVCSLYPTRGCPTMVIAGFPMHRIKETDPSPGHSAKVRAAAPIVGNVPGYDHGPRVYALEAARTASHVTTIELDPASLECGASQPLVTGALRQSEDHPANRQQLRRLFRPFPTQLSPASSTIRPPSPGGELYSGEFYRQCYRVLARGGRLFPLHRQPQERRRRPGEPGAIKRLKEAGFDRIVPKYEAFGVVAFK
jgi:predicted methyltransferase